MPHVTCHLAVMADAGVPKGADTTPAAEAMATEAETKWNKFGEYTDEEVQGRLVVMRGILGASILDAAMPQSDTLRVGSDAVALDVPLYLLHNTEAGNGTVPLREVLARNDAAGKVTVLNFGSYT